MELVKYIVTPLIVLVLSLVIDYLNGEVREKVCPIHPVRVCWIFATKVISILKLRNDKLHGVLLWFLTVPLLTIAYSFIPFILYYLSISRNCIVLTIFYAVVSSCLLKFTFSYKLLKWYVQTICSMFEEGKDAIARVLLQEIVRRDVFSIHDRGLLVSALIETYFESIIDGFISPLFWYSLLDIPGAYIQRLANTMDSLVGYNYPPFDKLGYFSAKIDTVINRLPCKIFSKVLQGLCRKYRNRYVRGIVEVSGSLGVNAREIFSMVAACLQVRLEKPGEYCIGHSTWSLPDVSTVKLSVKLAERTIVTLLILLAFLCVLRQIVLAILVLLF